MLPLPRIRLLVAGALLAGFALAGSVPAPAQVIVTPDTVAVSLAEGETAEVVLGVTGAAASKPQRFALSLAPAPTADDPPEPPGTVLFTSEDTCCSLDGITSTPDGRLFVDIDIEIYEFTPTLKFVREFDLPRRGFFSVILGITYDADRESLWWIDVLRECSGIPGCVIKETLFVEGTLDGEATGRTLPAPRDLTPRCGEPTGFPVYPAYDAEATASTTGGTGYFYSLDQSHDTLWATDSLGQVVEGYPYPMTDYVGIPQPFNEEGCTLNDGLDAHALGGEPVLETLGVYPYVHPNNRPYTVVVTDRQGRNRGAETPLFDLEPPDDYGDVLLLYGVERSRLDPSVLYLTATTGFVGFNARDYVYAVRAVPLPPPWLHANPILFEVDGGAETEITLTLDATDLEPGVYEGVASVREGDGIGEVVAEVPVTLTVAPVEAEDAPQEPEGFALGEPYPNPSSGGVTVPVVLGAPAEVRIAVYDALGREVAVLHDGPLAAGEHRLRFDGRGLPAGVYVVRAESETVSATERITLLR